MTILAQRYRLAGTQLGRRVIEEAGECTDLGTTITTLRSYETGRVQLEALPRAAGLVAKPLDGSTLPALQSVGDAQIGGALSNCLQLGRTEFAQLAPEQPVGTYAGRRILAFRRLWIQMSG
jgi:hypothetical protein